VVAGAEPGGFIGAVGDRISEIRPRIRVELLAAGRVGERPEEMTRRVGGDVVGRRATHVVVVIPPRSESAPERTDPLPELLKVLGGTGAKLIWLGAEPPPEPSDRTFAAICLIGPESFDVRGELTRAGHAKAAESLWAALRPTPVP
jgi:hypothetical protein